MRRRSSVSAAPLRQLSAALALAAALAAAPAAAQRGVLSVTVVDSATKAPVAGAQVSVDGRARGATDAAGALRVEGLAAGERAVEVARIGYGTRRVTVAVGDAPVEARVELAAAPVTIGGVQGQARPTARQRALEEFYERKERRHTGYFVTREDIERRKPRRVSDLFRGIPNLRVSENNGTATMESGRGMQGPSAGCPLLYYVDGVLNPLLEIRDMDSLMDNINAEFRPEDLEGIEVYLGGNAPPRYGGSRGRCGVVLVWTRVPETS